jgi:hypothetical protein
MTDDARNQRPKGHERAPASTSTTGAGGGLGLEIMDGGTIQFRIASAALAAGDWGASMAYADSC